MLEDFYAARRHHPNLEVILNVMVSIILWDGSLAESISFADDEMKRDQPWIERFVYAARLSADGRQIGGTAAPIGFKYADSWPR